MTMAAATPRSPQVEKVMKALFVRKLHLWPRFETSAKAVLDAGDQNIEARSCALSRASIWSTPHRGGFTHIHGGKSRRAQPDPARAARR